MNVVHQTCEQHQILGSTKFKAIVGIDCCMGAVTSAAWQSRLLGEQVLAGPASRHSAAASRQLPSGEG